MVFRLDFAELLPPKKLVDGRVIVEARLTRTGVFEYRNPDGSTRREYRPAEQVFAQTSMDSFALIPVTNDHPAQLLTAKTARYYTVGQLAETVRKDGNHLIAKLVINDSETIDQIVAGKRDVSAGYTCDCLETPGVTPDGERYDAIQTNIVANHLAIVTQGRAGTAQLRFDGSQIVGSTDDKINRGHMDLEQALAALASAQEKLGAEKVRADSAESKASALELECTKAQATIAELNANIAATTKAHNDSLQSFDTRVVERVALEAVALQYLGEGKRSDLSDRQIKVEIVKKLDGVEIAVERSDDAVQLAFELATARAAKQAKNDSSNTREEIISRRLDAPVSQNPEADAIARRKAALAAKVSQ